jgi:two-component system LytT family response regulator
MSGRLRVFLADDERPARALLKALLGQWDDVQVVGEADNGAEALAVIERQEPDLALLDLQMPEVDGLEVARLLDPARAPLVAFVTAYDEYAARAFELHAVDYVLKPVEAGRLRETLDRARQRLARPAWRGESRRRMESAARDYDAARGYLERIPVRRRDDVVLVPVEALAAVVAEGELLHLTTVRNEKYVITYRLKDLEARLDPRRFVRLSRGTLANLRFLSRFSPMPGGLYLATLVNGQELTVSRSQSRVLREHLLKL